MKVDQNLSLRVWHIHIKIMHRYARGSCPPPQKKKGDGWWLKTMLLHTICSVISVKLLMINNSWWCVVFRNPYVSIGSSIVCHCFERTSLMIQGCVIIPFEDPLPFIIFVGLENKLYILAQLCGFMCHFTPSNPVVILQMFVYSFA